MTCILNDIGIPFSFPGVEVLNIDALTDVLREWDGWSTLDPTKTRIIFPGKGAADVQVPLGHTFL